MKKKLTIHRETIRTLTSSEMQNVVGGAVRPNSYSMCDTCYQCDSITGWSDFSCGWSAQAGTCDC